MTLFAARSRIEWGFQPAPNEKRYLHSAKNAVDTSRIVRALKIMNVYGKYAEQNKNNIQARSDLLLLFASPITIKQVRKKFTDTQIAKQNICFSKQRLFCSSLFACENCSKVPYSPVIQRICMNDIIQSTFAAKGNEARKCERNGVD